MASRLRGVKPAVRPKMYGRGMIAGPSGAGKTWTLLSIATYLAAFEYFLAAGGDPKTMEPGDIDISKVQKKDILVMDTEKESALTYADVFEFDHLAWRAPYDPSELNDTLAELSENPPLVTIVDTFSKFWQGQGGTLDIAGAAIGGWKVARPVQEALIEQILATNCHVLLGVRSKMEYLIEGGKGNQTVTRLGLAPVQDDALMYEMNVSLDIDMQHQITVSKSRTPAVPVGRMYPAGLERKLAEDYADWLAGGIPPANRQDVDAIVERFSAISAKDDKIRVKTDFVERFGMPHSLTADRVPLANQWLDAAIAELDAAAPAEEEAEDQSDKPDQDPPAAEDAGSATEDEAADDAAEPAEEGDWTVVERGPEDQAQPEQFAVVDGEPAADSDGDSDDSDEPEPPTAEVTEAMKVTKAELRQSLDDRGIPWAEKADKRELAELLTAAISAGLRVGMPG